MWNNRVEITKTESDNFVEFSASIVEVYYGFSGVSNTGEIAPMGTGETEHQAILGLKEELERMLESVNFVLEGKTSVYNYLDSSTHHPGEPSSVVKKNEVLDADDAFMDERYGDEH